jgi:hypothetical protein
MTVRHANADKVRRSRGMLLLFSQPQFLFRFILRLLLHSGLNVDHILRQDSSFISCPPHSCFVTQLFAISLPILNDTTTAVGNGQFTCKCLNGGVKKGLSMSKQACKSQRLCQDSPASARSWPCYSLHSSATSASTVPSTFQLQPHRHHMHFGSRLCGGTHSPCTPKHVQLGGDPQYMKHLLVIFRYTSML